MLRVIDREPNAEVCAAYLCNHPEDYFTQSRGQKVVQNNLLWKAGLYFDIEDSEVKNIPHNIAVPDDAITISPDYDLIVPKPTR